MSAARAEVLGRDDRQALPYELEERLYDSIGILVYKVRDRKGRLLKKGRLCTATCVGRHLILTAAHCVMGTPRNPEVPDLGTMRFIMKPYKLQESLVFDLAGMPADVERRRLMRAGPGNVKRFSGDHARDWALLPLDPARACPAPLPVAAVSPTDKRMRRGKPLELIGFHGDILKRKDIHLRASRCRVPDDEQTRAIIAAMRRKFGAAPMPHECDAYHGASGSPIFMRDKKGGRRIVAVHSGSYVRYRRYRNRRTGKVVKKRLLRKINVAAPATNFIRAVKEMNAVAEARAQGGVSDKDVQDTLKNALGLLFTYVIDKRTGKRRLHHCAAACVGPREIVTAARCVGLGVNAPYEFIDSRMIFALKPWLWRHATKLLVSGDDFYNTESAVLASGVKAGGPPSDPGAGWVILRLVHRARNVCPATLPLLTHLPPRGVSRTALVGFDGCALRHRDLRPRWAKCRVRALKGKNGSAPMLIGDCTPPALVAGSIMVVKKNGVTHLFGLQATWPKPPSRCSPGPAPAGVRFVISPATRFAPALARIHSRASRTGQR